MKQIKILLADDHRIVLEGLTTLLSGIPEFKVAAAVNDGEAALDKAKQLKIDVALLDINMPVLNGIETTYRLKKNHPDIKVIGLSTHNEKGIIKKILEAGANGYLLKNTGIDELAQAIRTVHGGKQYLSSDVSLLLLTNDPHPVNIPSVNIESLSKREIEIAGMVAKGFSSKQIAEKLFISPRTVDTHRSNIMEKLQLKSIPELVYYCMKNNLI